MKKWLLISILFLWATTLRAAESASTLPGSSPWALPSDIAAEQYAEMRSFYEDQITEAAGNRSRLWNVDASSVEAFRKSIAQNMAEFRKMIGAVDTFRPPKPQVTKIGDAGAYTAHLAEWPILGLGTVSSTEGLTSSLVYEYGILLVPAGAGPFPAVIVVSDATHSGADSAGLTDLLPPLEQYARQLAKALTTCHATLMSSWWEMHRSLYFRQMQRRASKLMAEAPMLPSITRLPRSLGKS